MTNIPRDGMRANSTSSRKKSSGQKTSKSLNHQPQVNEVNIDLRNDPAAYLGRSTIQFKGKTLKVSSFDPAMVNNIAADLNALDNNPNLVKKSEVAFGRAYEHAKSQGEASPYEYAVKMQQAFVEEFADK